MVSVGLVSVAVIRIGGSERDRMPYHDLHRISMASPKLKKRYRSLTASS